MKRVLITITLALFTLPIVNAQDIKLSGTVSAEYNQIKKVAVPTDPQDAATKKYIDSLIANLQGQIDNAEAVDGSVVDIDRNKYEYINYGVKAWTIKNAEVVRYNDGTIIPQATSNFEWKTRTTGAWCYYNNDPTKGKLYNWYAVAGIHDDDSFADPLQRKKFAPEGWHVPTHAEWTDLENYLILAGYNDGGAFTGNRIAKAMASKTDDWDSSNDTGAVGNNQAINNISGFNAFPAGYRFLSSNSNDITFHFEGIYAFFWSSTEDDDNDARYRYLYYDDYKLDGDVNSKNMGYSVRFVRDE